MSAQAAPAIDSARVVERLLQRATKDQLVKLVDSATATSGQVLGSSVFEPGDELCPVIRFPFPLPPRFDQFLNVAATLGPIRLFTHGIINPEAVIVQVGIPAVQR